MFNAISITQLETVTGGAACSSCARRRKSHADHLAEGNGGVAPKLRPLSHRDHLQTGNGGVVQKLRRAR